MKSPLLIAALCCMASPALAFVPSIPRSFNIERIQDCVQEKFGYAVPEIAPVVNYSPEWSKPGEGMCCTDDGQIADARSRAYATYRAFGRIITLYRGAGLEDFAHEVASDQFVQATRNYSPRAREEFGYRAGRECGWRS